MPTTLQDLKPSQIKPNSANPRTDVGNVDELAASISEAGILEPLIVAPTGTGRFQTFVLIAGHRRLAAAKQAKCKTVPCIVREDLGDEQTQLEHMLIENLHRADLTPVEEAQAYQALLEFPGYTMKRITQATGRSAATVRARVKLAGLSEDVRGKLHAGQVSLHDAQALVEFAAEPDIAARLESSLGTPNFAYELEAAQAARKRVKDLAAAEGKLRKAGVRVVTENELEQLAQAAQPVEDENGPTGDYIDQSEVWVYVDADGDLNDLPVKPEDHATCPGHAAFLTSARVYTAGGGTTQQIETHYVCTQPKLHPELTEQPARPAESDDAKAERVAREARQAERERLTGELAVAARVRRAHLAAFATSLDAIAVANSMLIDAVLRGAQYGRGRSLLSALLCPDVEGIATAGGLRKAMTDLGLASLAVLLDLVDKADQEMTLDQPVAWGPQEGAGPYYQPHKQTEAWRRRLVDVYGYTFSDVEAQLNAPPAVVDVDLPGGDSDV